MQRGKNVAIANALQLEAVRATPVSAFPLKLRHHAKLGVAEPYPFPYYSAMTLTFDL